MDQIITVKPVSDLHSNYLSQRIVYQYLAMTHIDSNIAEVRSSYRHPCDCVVSMIEDTSPESVGFTRPHGRMFVWLNLNLPDKCPSMGVFEAALSDNVAVLPRLPFYVDGGGENTPRLNFSNFDEKKLTEGMGRLAGVIHRFSRGA